MFEALAADPEQLAAGIVGSVMLGGLSVTFVLSEVVVWCWGMWRRGRQVRRPRR